MMLSLRVFPLHKLFLVLVASLPFGTSTQTVLSLPPERDQYGPNVASARANAKIIFNTVHSATRQWGSSVHHNGVSVFPVTVPEGTLLYHGNAYAEVPKVPEWLAFEIEHSENFARKMIFSSRSSSGVQAVNEPDALFPESRGPYKFDPGYLHVYQANRPLRLLYFDGMSAATASHLGTSDMQEYMFLDRTWNHDYGDIMLYAAALCKKGAEWGGVEGFVRMEAGFEIIKCNFSDGLDLISHNRRPRRTTPEGQSEGWLFEWLRAVTLRYNGIDGSRIIVDFSSMIHAGFYPTNLTNPDPENSHLPRLVSADPAQVARIRSDAKNIWLEQSSRPSVDWQGVVDMIEKRFSDRLQYLATKPPIEPFVWEINVLLNTFINYESFSLEESIETCASHYLRPVIASTRQDKLIYAAVKAVTTRICSTLFQVRATLLARHDANGSGSEDTLKSVELIHELVNWLDWTAWRMCRPSCPYDQICLIAVSPFGNRDLHYNPRCVNSTGASESMFFDDNYWFDEDFSHKGEPPSSLLHGL